MEMKYLYLLFLVSIYYDNGMSATLKFHPDSLRLSAVINERGDLTVEDGISSKSPVASVQIGEATNKTGWTYVYGWTNGNYSDLHQAYAVGYLEARIDSQMLLQYRNSMENTCKLPNTVFCKKLHRYLTSNINFMKSQILKFRKTNRFWHQVELMLWQIQGMDEAFKGKHMRHSNAITPTQLSIDPFGIFLWQMAGGDIAELTDALNSPKERRTDEERLLVSGHCSGLIKRTPNNGQLLVSHTTWTEYYLMLRHLKLYEFNFRETAEPNSPFIAGASQAFSSYPGSIMSADDFYVLDTKMVTLETTNTFYNDSLFDVIRNSANSTVFEFLRTQVANRLSVSVSEWQSLFANLNSGTYNNQWMAVDYKKVTDGQPLPTSGVLGVSEQIPGTVVSKDMTKILRNTSYWPSYNTPMFPEIYEKSNYAKMVKKYGNFFTYDSTPRALIFRRDHHKVVDERTMIRLMRYNNFKKDPLSRCKCQPPFSGENAIAARSDLNLKNGSYPFSALGRRYHGAIDMKLAAPWLFSDLGFIAVSSPTYDQQPPFRWSKSGFNVAHFGHPDLWNFKPIITPWRRVQRSDRSQPSFYLDPHNVVVFPY